MYMWLNRLLITDYAEYFLETYMADIASQSFDLGVITISLICFCLMVATAAFLFFCCLSVRFFGSRKKILALFKRIPR